MSFSQYRRLILLAVLPLLGAGWLFAQLVAPYDRYIHVTCGQFLAVENCRNLGTGGNLYEHAKADYPAWFDIQLGREETEASLNYTFEGSQRTVVGARIISASPFAGLGSDAGQLMGEFLGKTAIIQLGIDGGKRSFLLGDNAVIYCNSLDFGERSGEYDATCYGQGWSGSMGFFVAGESKEMLDKLRLSMQEEVKKWDRDYLIYRIVMYPMFIYMFLIGSALIWLARKSFRYVRFGWQGVATQIR